jgi:hypothetical protein
MPKDFNGERDKLTMSSPHLCLVSRRDESFGKIASSLEHEAHTLRKDIEEGLIGFQEQRKK